jgi:hypothetical protein
MDLKPHTAQATHKMSKSMMNFAGSGARLSVQQQLELRSQFYKFAQSSNYGSDFYNSNTDKQLKIDSYDNYSKKLLDHKKKCLLVHKQKKSIEIFKGN